LLEADNIYKSFHNEGIKLDVLKGINLSIEKAAIYALIGPSGAGKSTLLHILGGLDRPSSGNIFFDGINIYSAGDNERSFIRNKRIGFVFQFYHLLDEFSAIENIMMPGLMGSFKKAARKRIKDRAESLLDSIGLLNRANHRPSQLSGGEAQRVSIARALINNPDLILCDEPTGNLDSGNAAIVLDLIRALNDRLKRTFLVVTHNEDIAGFADHVIHIEDGKIK
jgi:lipoprotein-releasing system ATP-binding protein